MLLRWGVTKFRKLFFTEIVRHFNIKNLLYRGWHKYRIYLMEKMGRSIRGVFILEKGDAEYSCRDVKA